MKGIIDGKIVDIKMLQSNENEWYHDGNGIFTKEISELCKESFVIVTNDFKERWEREHPVEEPTEMAE